MLLSSSSSSSQLVRIPKRTLFRGAAFEVPQHLLNANAREIYSCISSLLPGSDSTSSSSLVVVNSVDEEEEEEKKENEESTDADPLASDLTVLNGLSRVALAAKYWIYLRWVAKAKDEATLESSLAAVEGQEITTDVNRRIVRGMEAMCIFLCHPELLKRVLSLEKLDFGAFAHLNKKQLTYETLDGAISTLESKKGEENGDEERNKQQKEPSLKRRLGYRDLEQAMRGEEQPKRKKRKTRSKKKHKQNDIQESEDEEEEEEEEETDGKKGKQRGKAEKEKEGEEEKEDGVGDDVNKWCPFSFHIPTAVKCSSVNGHALFCKHHKEWMKEWKAGEEEEEEEEDEEGDDDLKEKLLQQLARATSAGELLDVTVALQCWMRSRGKD